MARRRRRRARPRTRRRSNPAPARSRRRRGNPRSRGNPGTSTGRDKAFIVAGAALYGYIDNHVEALDKVPVIDAIGPQFSHGIVLHFIARNTSGMLSKWTDLMSVAALSIGGYKFGKAKGDLTATVGPMSIGGDDEVMGHLGDGDNAE